MLNFYNLKQKKDTCIYTCGKDGKCLMDSNGKPKMGRRGVILSRRDNCKYMKDVYADDNR